MEEKTVHFYIQSEINRSPGKLTSVIVVKYT